MEERFDWKRTIKVNIIMLKIVGLWPAGDETYGWNIYTLYEIFSILFIQIGHIAAQAVNVLLYFDDLQIVTGSIYVLLMEMLGLFKSYFLIKNMGTLKQLMVTVNCDLFQPKSSQQRKLIQPNLDAWRTIASTFWFFCWGWLLIWILCPVFDKTFEEYRLPFLAWYPYDTQTSPQYEFTYFHQFIGISCISMVNVNIDTLVAALNMYIGAQIDLLCDDLKHFHDGSKNNTADAIGNLKSCIHHHREILKFAEYANNFYNWLIFMEFLIGGVSIGLGMFRLSVVIPLSSEFYSFVSYTFCICIQVYMYCWFGNEIEVKVIRSSGLLPYAVFESDWTELSPEVKKMMIFLFLKVQKPLKMSAFGLFCLSLETFIKILKTSWSYFAVLRQVNLRK
ncbi:7tm 6 domain containing protein, partial [Asbolus verrucosus]